MGEIKDVKNYINNKYKNAIIKKRGSLEDNSPHLSSEWDYEKNYPLTPKDVTSNSSIRVWWKCQYGHSWQAKVGNRNNGRGCPCCAKEIRTSFPEQAIYYYINKCYNKAENGFILNGNEIDIYLTKYKIGIEYDGSYYHKQRDEKEIKKYKELKKDGIYLIRVRENEIEPVKNSYDDYILSKYIRNDFENLNKTIKELIKKIDAIVKRKSRIIVDTEKEIIDIQKSYFQNKKEKSIGMKFPIIASEFDIEKNGGLTPYLIYVGDNRKYWWKCKKGHSYKESPNNRCNNHNCPICSNHQVLTEYNDLFTQYPKLAKEFDKEKNKKDTKNVLAGGNKKYWWKCKKGHSYLASCSQRINHNSGCPYCSGHKVIIGLNDLETIKPDLVEEWDIEGNNGRKPSEFKAGSGYMASWICKKCGYKWKASINSRKRGRGCPKCGLNRISESKSKKIQQFSLDGKLIAEYNSITEAELSAKVKHISDACRGIRKTAGGFIWKYKEEKND